MSVADLPSAVATVACSGTTHQLIWDAGTLQTPDHADPDAERALMGLGGNPCRCVELLDAWEAHATDPRTLTVGPRGPKITVVTSDTSWSKRGVAYMRRGGIPTPPPVGLEDLMLLHGPLPRRLVASAAAHVIASHPAPAENPRLHSALYGRALVALGRWLGELPTLELTVLGPGDAPSLHVDGRQVHAALAPDWLVDVWGAGLEIVADRFVLSASPTPPDGWNLCVVDHLMTVNSCTLSLS